MTVNGLLAPGPLNRQFPAGMISRLSSGALRGAIRFYQLTLAYFFVGACRYEPSCSAYAIEAVRVHGALDGGLLAVRLAQHVHMAIKLPLAGTAGVPPLV
jgi:putative membrane protein insertion efficiency factor